MRGVLLFAFNNGVTDYYQMAIETAKRANRFLNLPVTVVTDSTTDLSKYDYTFDQVLLQDADVSNKKDSQIWINKGRYNAYNLSPYTETLLLDTDYLINSDMLLKTFDLCEDIICHNRTSYLMEPHAGQEHLSTTSFDTLWATVIVFRKTNKSKQVFECMKMIQENYKHYANTYGFLELPYRNDYSLTIALRIVNGNLDNPVDFIPWNLVHASKEIKVYRNTDTEYLVMLPNQKTEYIIIKDTDFHMLSKENFMELV